MMGLGAAGVAGIYYHYATNLPSPEELDYLPYRVQRIVAWIAPERYADDQSFQTMQALYAIGSGNFTGKGLGNSIQKLQHIPEAQNDMIFSVICEELGWIGGTSILLLLAEMGVVFSVTREF